MACHGNEFAIKAGLVARSETMPRHMSVSNSASRLRPDKVKTTLHASVVYESHVFVGRSCGGTAGGALLAPHLVISRW